MPRYGPFPSASFTLLVDMTSFRPIAIPYPEGAAPKPWPRCLVPKVPINSSVSAKKKQFNGQAKAGYGDGKEEDNIKSKGTPLSLFQNPNPRVNAEHTQR